MTQLRTLFYDQLGGEKGLRRLVVSFYLHMDLLPETKELRAIHPDDLTGSADKLFLFLSGWTGGPQLFVEKYGDPRLRARHLPFAIRKSERDQWMLCMASAVDACDIKEPVRSEFLHAILALADHMRNAAESNR